jgi:putative ABC transport system permease protein
MVKERAFDLALLRTYGASNFQLIRMVAYEGLTIGFLAFMLGLLLSKAGLYFLFKMVEIQYKQNMLQELPYQQFLQTGALVSILILISISLAIYPIIKMNISTILSHEK